MIFHRFRTLTPHPGWCGRWAVVALCLLLASGCVTGRPSDEPGPRSGSPSDDPVILTPTDEVLDAVQESGAEEVESSLLDDLIDQAQFTIDIASRVSFSRELDKVGIRNMLGFDYRQVFSGRTGDWGVMVLQGYLTRSDHEPRRPPFIADDHDTEFQFRIFSFNYTGLARGRLNFKVGHVELPYGLEATVDTNGTLRQFLPGANLGYKADWGVTVNGVLPEFEYEVALTQGAGNEPDMEDGRFLLTGRVGTPIEADRIFGGSFMYARLPGGGGDRFTRWRVGADYQEFALEPFAVSAELSVGEDDSMGVMNRLGELSWSTPFNDWFVYGQVRVLARERTESWDEAVQAALGVSFRPDLHWNFSLQLSQDLETFHGKPEDTFLSFQTRYRF